MKKNNIFTGILIGMAMILIPLLITGTNFKSISNTDVQDTVGRYQVSTTALMYTPALADAVNGTNLSYWVFETTIDTETGEIISQERKNAFIVYTPK